MQCGGGGRRHGSLAHLSQGGRLSAARSMPDTASALPRSLPSTQQSTRVSTVPTMRLAASAAAAPPPPPPQVGAAGCARLSCWNSAHASSCASPKALQDTNRLAKLYRQPCSCAVEAAVGGVSAAAAARLARPTPTSCAASRPPGCANRCCTALKQCRAASRTSLAPLLFSLPPGAGGGGAAALAKAACSSAARGCESQDAGSAAKAWASASRLPCPIFRLGFSCRQVVVSPCRQEWGANEC